MVREVPKIKQYIIERLEKATESYEDIWKNTQGIKEAVIDIEPKISETIDNLQKNVHLWNAIPDECFLNPSSQFESLVQSADALSRDFYEDSLRFQKGVHKSVQDMGMFSPSANTALTSSSTMKNISANATRLFVTQFPKLEPVIKESELPSPLEARKTFSQELAKIELRLSEKFDGAWGTINDTTKPDRFRQAAHSMREVLSDFLEILAPDNKVKETIWFKSCGEEQPTQRLRAKYAIIGNSDEKTMRQEYLNTVNNLMDIARNTYKDLNKIAHNRGKENLFPLTESYLVTCQNTIKLILELREQFFRP